MAIKHFIVGDAQFNSAANAYASVAALRPTTHDDDGIERLNDRIEPLFTNLVFAPVHSLAAVVRKGEAIIAEEGECGLIERELVEALAPGLVDALDVGSGSGILALAAARLGLAATGIDVEEAAVREAREGVVERDAACALFGTALVRDVEHGDGDERRRPGGGTADREEVLEEAAIGGIAMAREESVGDALARDSVLQAGLEAAPIVGMDAGIDQLSELGGKRVA